MLVGCVPDRDNPGRYLFLFEPSSSAVDVDTCLIGAGYHEAKWYELSETLFANFSAEVVRKFILFYFGYGFHYGAEFEKWELLPVPVLYVEGGEIRSEKITMTRGIREARYGDGPLSHALPRVQQMGTKAGEQLCTAVV